MTGLLDLSNELLTAIAKYITKPSDKLHFAFLNKQSCERIIPLLYEHIIFDYKEYATPKLPRHRIHPNQNKRPRPLKGLAPPPPCSNLVGLTKMISSGYQSHGAFQNRINALTIKLEANSEGNEVQIAFYRILPLLPHLTHLHFEFLANYNSHQPEVFSFAPLAGATSPLSGTLRSLSIYVSEKDKTGKGASDGWTIGSLRHFHALAALSIQVAALMGMEDGAIMAADLNELLPPKLQHFELYCPISSPEMLSGVLRKWLFGEVQHPWTLKTITLHIVKEITLGDAVLWSVFETIREQARLLGHDVELKMDISQNYVDPH